jgi:hypothetical protein
MELSSMMIWGAVLISLIIFIIALVKGFKVWGVFHTVLLSILFIECWTFIFFAAIVSEKRIAETKSHDLLTKQMELDMFGDRLDPGLNLEKFVPLSNEVNRLALERGRVWRGARRQALQTRPGEPASFAVQLPPAVTNNPVAPPADAAAGAAAPVVAAAESALATESVVYAFGEVMSPVGLIPNVYLGEYLVLSNKDNLVTLRPTATLSKVQENAINVGANETWAIYEVVPIDSHKAFAALGSKPEEDAIHGRMDKAAIAQLLGIDPALADANPASLKPEDARKAKLLQSYVLDGGRAPEQLPADAPELSIRVTFIQDYTIKVDSKQERTALDGGYFDLEGLAVDARLKSDNVEGVVFKAGDVYVFDAATAKRLETQGFVKPNGERMFVRPLNDYDYGFRDTRRLKIRADQDLLLVDRELKEITRTTGVTADQEIKRAEENNRLKLDKAQYDKENAVITEVAESLAKQIEDKKSELSSLYGSLVSLHDRIVKRNRELTGK